MADLPLSKTIDPADFFQLAEELEIVDASFKKDRPQHPMRRWEYAMALKALQRYETQTDNPNQIGQVVDVGGAGSPFWRMLAASGFHRVQVIDPDENCTLEEHLHSGPPLADAVFCLSVLEHVDDLDRFCYHLSCLVAPGGLLFLTMDCREDDDALCQRIGDWCWPTDDRHFHWMRKRIFTPRMILAEVIDPLSYLGFSICGQVDGTPLAYHGPQVYDYTFASLCLIKRP